MAIETIGSMQRILNTDNSADWIKSADLSLNSPGEAAESDTGGLSTDEKIKSFGQLLTDSIKDVNGLQQEANMAIEKLASGQNKNIEETMMAVERAEIAFKMMNQIRMKVIDAYREVMRMQI